MFKPIVKKKVLKKKISLFLQVSNYLTFTKKQALAGEALYIFPMCSNLSSEDGRFRRLLQNTKNSSNIKLLPWNSMTFNISLVGPQLLGLFQHGLRLLDQLSFHFNLRFTFYVSFRFLSINFEFCFDFWMFALKLFPDLSTFG